MYFALMDTIMPQSAEKDKIIYISTLNNQIVGERSLYEFGYPNSDGYNLYRGRKGIGIIESFFRNESEDSYFRVYNFDTDSGSNFIKYSGYSEPYFLDGGKYLVLSRTEYIEEEYSMVCTGVFDIYNVTSGNLIKSIYLPSKGRVYTFDNYPNTIYYYLEDENRSIPIDINTILSK